MTAQTHIDDHERRQIQPGGGRTVEPGLSRRAMLTGMGAALGAAAAGGTVIPALGQQLLAATECVTEVEAIEAAFRVHSVLFLANDRGEGVSDAEVWAALDPIDDAVLALCRCRPVTAKGQVRRRTKLLKILAAEIEGRAEWAQDIFAALLTEGGA
jgi:hypothetical protein